MTSEDEAKNIDEWFFCLVLSEGFSIVSTLIISPIHVYTLFPFTLTIELWLQIGVIESMHETLFFLVLREVSAATLVV